MRPGGKRNNRWGKNLIWACIQALMERYGNGHFSTFATHKAHLLHFSKWLKQQKINDVMKITQDDLLIYAKYVKQKYSNNYARNLISSANVILESVREDRKIRIDPSTVLEQRKSARTNKPAGMDIVQVEKVAEELTHNGHQRIAILILLIRVYGMRLKESCLLDLRVALRQATKNGQIDVRRGTKGGRGKHVERWVPATEKAVEVLSRAQAFCSTETHSLIPMDMTAIAFMRLIKREWRKVRSKYGLCKIHDLRAAFACDRYRKITGHDAPACNGGKIIADKNIDRIARDVIVTELGHGHRGRMSPYVGRGAR